MIKTVESVGATFAAVRAPFNTAEVPSTSSKSTCCYFFPENDVLFVELIFQTSYFLQGVFLLGDIQLLPISR